MIAKATVYLTEDRKTVVPAGDKRARFKLVHIGQEIPDAEVDKYDGAAALIGGTKKAEHAEPAREKIETRQPHVETRDPKHKHR